MSELNFRIAVLITLISLFFQEKVTTATVVGTFSVTLLTLLIVNFIWLTGKKLLEFYQERSLSWDMQ
jgi:uncharacterized membrane protein